MDNSYQICHPAVDAAVAATPWRVFGEMVFTIRRVACVETTVRAVCSAWRFARVAISAAVRDQIRESIRSPVAATTRLRISARTRVTACRAIDGPTGDLIQLPIESDTYTFAVCPTRRHVVHRGEYTMRLLVGFHVCRHACAPVLLTVPRRMPVNISAAMS